MISDKPKARAPLPAVRLSGRVLRRVDSGGVLLCPGDGVVCIGGDPVALCMIEIGDEISVEAVPDTSDEAHALLAYKDAPRGEVTEEALLAFLEKHDGAYLRHYRLQTLEEVARK